MREFLEFIAKHLVDRPEDVKITMEDRENRVIFRLQVGEGDVGKVIGRKGRTANAMRVLLSAVAAKEGKRAILEILQ
ncbi:MAG: KH domain-containing protein [Candidatus Kryptonium sp.]|nr:KH domain-containing protein [Candidatus Kryptonium sp.]MCX7761561.1 KH domain-containing protein [Candidatus Kryptonium sp.]